MLIGWEQHTFSMTSFSTAYLLLGVTLSVVSALVALRERRALFLGWAVVWATQPLALMDTGISLGESGGGSLTFWPSIVTASHCAVLVMSAWSQVRGNRSLRLWGLVLALSIIAAGAIDPLFPGFWARRRLILLPAGSSVAVAVLFLTSREISRGTGLRLASFSFLVLGLFLFAESALQTMGLSAPVPSPSAELTSFIGFLFLVLSAAGLLLSRTESVERALYTVHARLDELRRHLSDAVATDPLTGFFSRRAFRDLVDHVRMGTATAHGFVLVLDMDGLKRINDTQGHTIGDKAIYRTARATESGLRAGDLPIRWGGDEFVVVLPGAGLVDAERTRNTIQSAIRHEGLSASIGLSAYGPDRDIVIALREADRLMYVAKRRRRDSRSIPTTQLQLPLEERLDAAPMDAP